jgi:hypothetical protein
MKYRQGQDGADEGWSPKVVDNAPATTYDAAGLNGKKV